MIATGRGACHFDVASSPFKLSSVILVMWPPDTSKKSSWTYKQKKKKKGESSAHLIECSEGLFLCELVGLLKHLKGSLESELYPTVPWPESIPLAFIGPSHFCGSLDLVTNFRSGVCEK